MKCSIYCKQKPFGLWQTALIAEGSPAVYGMLVSAEVVDEQVHVELGRDLLVVPPLETQELLVPVPGLALRDHRTVGHVQG